MSDNWEEQTLWQDILDQVVNGRTEGHKCPKCSTGTLDCKFDDPYVTIVCLHCGAKIDARLA